MITVDTCGITAYSPLIPAIKAMCTATPGETIEIIMNHADAFQDLKEYLSEQGIGFREIYDGEQMTVHNQREVLRKHSNDWKKTS